MEEPEINLNGWQTIKSAAAKWNTSTQVITNWIKRDKLPFREYPELNGLRLVPGEIPKK